LKQFEDTNLNPAGALLMRIKRNVLSFWHNYTVLLLQQAVMDWKQQPFSTYLDEHADCGVGVTAGDGSCTVLFMGAVTCQLYSVSDIRIRIEHRWNDTDRGKRVSTVLCPPQMPHRLA
jgi:hypothetical protein